MAEVDLRKFALEGFLNLAYVPYWAGATVLLCKRPPETRQSTANRRRVSGRLS